MKSCSIQSKTVYAESVFLDKPVRGPHAYMGRNFTHMHKAPFSQSEVHVNKHVKPLKIKSFVVLGCILLKLVTFLLSCSRWRADFHCKHSVWHVLRLNSQRVRINEQLAITIICLQLFFLVGIDRTENRVWTKIKHLHLHVCFMWMKLVVYRDDTD